MIFRYGDVASLSGALSETRGSLPLPEGETVADGEWVLAIFEIGSRRRATAAAAWGVRAAGDTHLAFERRDWDRLLGFVAARSEHVKAARAVGESAPPSRGAIAREAPTSEPPTRSRRLDDLPSSAAFESSRLPFGARVLVVDGEGGRIGAGGDLRAMLAEIGLVVELESTTKRAEERIKSRQYDAIVVDLHAPGCDSRGFVSKIRSDTHIADIPVLFLSSEPTSRDVVDAFASGGDDFLPKPFRTPELAARIFGLLRRARMARGAAGSSGR